MQVNKQQLELDMELDWFKIGKGVHQGCILSPNLFNLYAEYIMQNADEVQAGIKIVGRNINNLRYANNTTLMAEGDSLVAQLVKNPPAVQETRFDPWVGKIHGRRDRLPTPVFLGFPCVSDCKKKSTCNAGDLGLIPGLGRSPGEGKATHSSIVA